MEEIGSHAHFEANGYAVFRCVFQPDEIRNMAESTRRIRQMADSEEQGCGNLKFFRKAGRLRSVTWCSLLDPLLAHVRTDQRLLAIVRPYLGSTVRQLINNLHWKPPGSVFSISFHTDRQNRVRGQGSSIRNLPDSYLQTGIAIDAMRTDNGPLLVVPGSHRNLSGPLPDTAVYCDGADDVDAQIKAWGYSSEDVVEIHLDPGDVAIWSPDLVHGSSINRHHSFDRCFYVNGYVNARDCFLGYWACIDGVPIPLPDKTIPVHVYGQQDFSVFPLA